MQEHKELASGCAPNRSANRVGRFDVEGLNERVVDLQ